MRIHRLIPLFVAVLAIGGCSGANAAEDDEDSAENELKTADLEMRGEIAGDECVHTAGARAKKYVAFSFEAKKDQEFEISLGGYASPDLRVLKENGRQLKRGVKRFEGDGVDGGHVSTAVFRAEETATYLVAIRDLARDPGAPAPDWLRPIVTLDATKTAKRPSACRRAG